MSVGDGVGQENQGGEAPLVPVACKLPRVPMGESSAPLVLNESIGADYNGRNS